MIVDEYGKCVQILGYRLRQVIEPRKFIEAARDVSRPAIVQLFDAETLAGEKHLFFATLNAIKSFTQGRNISKTLDIEILLYTSAQRQIGEAIRMVGLQPQTSTIAAVLVGENEKEVRLAARRLETIIPGGRDRSVLDRIGEARFIKLMRIYGVDMTELKALSDMGREEALQWLIVERGALLDARR